MTRQRSMLQIFAGFVIGTNLGAGLIWLELERPVIAAVTLTVAAVSSIGTYLAWR